MKQEYKDWFIGNRDTEQEAYSWSDRSYKFTNIEISRVPFHEELRDYIYSFPNIDTEATYDMYHIHTWEEGDFFYEHIDSRYSRKWAFISELQPSDCNTKLMVEGKEFEEGVIGCFDLHGLPKIQKGTRISLTVFGSTKHKHLLL